jgi:hypothetical protein
MLSLQDIQHISPNLAIVREGITQAEQRLRDALETKQGLEQKAFILLGGYVSLSTALFGLAANLGHSHMMFGLLVSEGIFFVTGAIALYISLYASNCGTMGRYPDTWLQPGTLDGSERTLATILAYVLHGYQDRISVSDQTNRRKALFLNVGLCFGIFAPAILGFGVATSRL